MICSFLIVVGMFWQKKMFIILAALSVQCGLQFTSPAESPTKVIFPIQFPKLQFPS